MTEFYWMTGPWTGRMAIAARVRGGDLLEGEISAWRRAGLDTIFSLLTRDEEKDLDLEREGAVSRAAGMTYISFPIVDRAVPDSGPDLLQLTARLDAHLARGESIVIHWRRRARGAGRCKRPGSERPRRETGGF